VQSLRVLHAVSVSWLQVAMQAAGHWTAGDPNATQPAKLRVPSQFAQDST
jgi:hypothetical protein